MLSAEQLQFVSRLKATKNNFLLLGPAGSGKTRIITHLQTALDDVAVTATTGIAAANFSGGITLHRFLGISDLSLPTDELLTRIINNKPIKERILKTKLLIVDEASMVSAAFLDRMDKILKSVRANEDPFGSLRIVLVGDLLQLPPVPSYRDPAKWLYEAESYNRAGFEIHRLKNVHRQTDSAFINCIKSLSNGVISKEVLAMLQKMGTNTVPEESLYVAATNQLVDIHNAKRLLDFVGVLKTFTAIDESGSDRRVLDCITGCKRKLRLKVDAPVIITQNIADKACNGDRGAVKEIRDNDILVELISGRVVAIERAQFSRRYADSLHIRTQFPLRLAWALTVHRCQGQTIPAIVIDCRRIYSQAMLAVALSRCTGEKDIELRYLDIPAIEALSPSSAEHVKFLETGDPPVQYGSESETEEDPPTQPIQTSSAQSVSVTSPVILSAEEIDSIDVSECPTVLAECFEELKTHSVGQLGERGPLFSSFVWKFLYSIFYKEGTLQNREEAMRSQHFFPSSTPYKQRCLPGKLPECYALYLKGVSMFTGCLVTLHSTAQKRPEVAQSDLSPADRGHLRYIAGEYMHRLRLRFSRGLDDLCITKPPIAARREVLISMIDSVCVTKGYVSDDPQSLKDIEIREYGHLIRVNDAAARFAYALHCHLKPFFMTCVECTTISQATVSAQTNEELFSYFKTCFPSSSQESCRELFDALVSCSVVTISREFRSDLANILKKTMALRKAVQVADTKVTEAVVEADGVVEVCWTCGFDETGAAKDQWIECSSCDCWFHQKCTTLSMREYRKISKDENAKWLCSMCQERLQGEMVMDGKQRYCICRSTDSKSFMIACDKCEEWFHGKCIKITPDKASAIKRYYCGACIKNDASLKIKYKKSKNKEKRKRDDDEPPSKKQKKPSKPATSADSKCCGSCEPCKMTQDCGTCDNCKDMKKNVGVSRSKQSCRLRQCKDMSQNPDEESTMVEPVSVLESKPKPKKTPAVPKQKRTTKLSIPKVPKPRKQYTRKNQDEAKVNKSAAEITADQCLGPRCIKMSRPGSKYCSDDCGMKLAAMRLVEIMPRRVAQWQSSPCIAEQKNRRELEEIRQKILEAKQHLESLDEKHKVIDKIVELGRKEKVKEEDSDEESKTDDEEEEEDMELFVYCVTCGLEVKQRSAFKHMERCFVKIERDMSFAGSFKSMIGGDTICDHYNSSTKSYCKRLKVICAEHAKDPKIADDEICGCPLNQDVFKHTGDLCKVAKKHCSDHFRWERMRRAEIDADKVRQWMKIDELFERERHTRAAMSNRAGVLSLLLHQTVDHEAIAASHHKIHTPLKSETRTPAVKSIPPAAGTTKNLSQSIGTNNKAHESVASVPLTVRSISPPPKAQPTIVSNTQNAVRNASQLIRQATPPTQRPQHTVRVNNLAIRPYTTSVSPNTPATQILNSSAPKPGQKSFLSVPLTINTVHGVSAGAAKHPTSLSASVQLANIAKQQTAASAVTLQLNRSLSNPSHTASKTIQSIVHRSVTPTTTQPQIVQITKSGVIRAGNRTPMLQNILKAPGTTNVPRMVHPKSRMIISADKMVTAPSARMIVGDNKAPITILTVRPGSDVIKPVISAIQQQTAAPASEHDYSTKK